MAITKRTVSGVQFSESSREPSWRLVHDGQSVHALFESTGITGTRHTLFCGTRAACEAEILRLKLTPLPPEPAPPIE